MSSTPRILAFAGSAREGSFSHKTLKVAVAGAEAAGAEVTILKMADYPLPLMDEDLERDQGLPENARKLHTFLVQTMSSVYTHVQRIHHRTNAALVEIDAVLRL